MPPGPSHGLVRGVVTATYCVDDPQHPLKLAGAAPTSVYCDCLVFGSAAGGSRFFFLPGVAVTQPFGGLHSGAVYKPKATTRLVSGKPLTDLGAADAAMMDGDHVLIAMVDGRNNQGVIIGHLPHPSRDVGNSPALPAGQRQQLKVADGDPLWLLKNGSVFGLDSSGNFTVDTTRATQNGLAPNSGDAPGTPGNGSVTWSLAGAAARSTQFVSAGQAILKEQLSAAGYRLDSQALPMSFQLTSAAGNGMKVASGGAAATVQIGDGSSHVAVAEQIRALWSAFEAWASSHVHSGGVLPGALTGPSATPAPGFNPAIISSSVSIPSA